MRRLQMSLVAAVAGLGFAGPASAQMNMSMPGMSMPGMKMPAARKPLAKKPAAKKVVVKRASAKTTKSGAKSSLLHSRPATKSKSLNAGHDISAAPGMAMPAVQDMKDMPGMAMPASSGVMASDNDLPAGNAPPPPVPTDHAADKTYGAAAMVMGRQHLQEFHGGQKMSQLLVSIAEYHFNRGRDGYQWVGQGWYGGDIDRLWVKSQGDGEVRGGVGRAEVQGLFSHAIGPYFNVQGGVRHDFKPNPSRTYATVGIEGLAPSFFDFEAALFLSNKGELMGRVEGTYDQRITQKLILQPRVEINAAAQNSRAIGIGSGLSDVEAGVRLRYDLRREFAPYVGVQYKRAFATTGRYLRDAGERRGGWNVLTGIRTWF